MELTIKSPRAKEKNNHKTESEISRIWYEHIDSLMEEATKAQNKMIKWSDSGRRDEIEEEIKDLNKEQVKRKIEEDIETCKEAYNILNQKVEEAYKGMEDIEITTTGMSIISSQEIIDSLF